MRSRDGTDSGGEPSGAAPAAPNPAETEPAAPPATNVVVAETISQGRDGCSTSVQLDGKR